MLTESQRTYLTAVAAMSNHPGGSYKYLCELHGWCFLSHKPVGDVLYEFHTSK